MISCCDSRDKCGDALFSPSRRRVTFHRLLGLLLGLGLGLPLPARADLPGRFDYYVLALSWSPQYCAGPGARGDPQCARPYGFVVHGLWPQHERGWPEDCGKGEWLSERLIERMLAIMLERMLERGGERPEGPWGGAH